MIENQSIKKMAASLTKKQKNVFADRRIMHPERDWFAGLFLSLLVLLGGVSFMIFQYFQFGEVTAESVELSEEAVVYRSGLVKDVLEDFQERKNTYVELKKELIGNRVIIEAASETSVEIALPEEVAVEDSPAVVEEIPASEEEEVLNPTLSI